MQCTVHEAEAAHCMQQVEATADLNCRLEAELAQLQHAVVCPRVQGCWILMVVMELVEVGRDKVTQLQSGKCCLQWVW